MGKREKMKFDYFYGTSASRYSFHQFPDLLLSHPAFEGVSYGCVILYALMLSRSALSASKGTEFMDEQGRFYIIYTVEEVMKKMRCQSALANKMLKELEDFGLIERVRRGQGKPSLTYVKDFSSIFDAFGNLKGGDKLDEIESLNKDEIKDEVEKELNYQNMLSENDEENNIAMKQTVALITDYIYCRKDWGLVEQLNKDTLKQVCLISQYSPPLSAEQIAGIVQTMNPMLTLDFR